MQGLNNLSGASPCADACIHAQGDLGRPDHAAAWLFAVGRVWDAGCCDLSVRVYVQVVVLGQVLAADINIGYEEMVNTRVRTLCMDGSRLGAGRCAQPGSWQSHVS